MLDDLTGMRFLEANGAVGAPDLITPTPTSISVTALIILTLFGVGIPCNMLLDMSMDVNKG